MATHAITIVVDFGAAYGFEGAETQMIAELLDRYQGKAFPMLVGGEVCNLSTVKVSDGPYL